MAHLPPWSEFDGKICNINGLNGHWSSYLWIFSDAGLKILKRLMYVYFVCLLFMNFLFLTVKSGIFVINTNENVVDSGGEVNNKQTILLSKQIKWMKVNTLHLEFGYLEVKDFLKVKTMLTSHKAKIRQRLEARQRSFKYKVVLSNNFEKVVRFYKLKKSENNRINFRAFWESFIWTSQNKCQLFWNGLYLIILNCGKKRYRRICFSKMFWRHLNR